MNFPLYPASRLACASLEKILVAEPPSCEENGPRKSEFLGSGAAIPQGEWAKEK